MKSFCLFFAALVSTSRAFHTVSPTIIHVRETTRLNLYATIEEAIAEAQRICSIDPNSQDCKVAWDIVEELEAADSHRGEMMPVDMSPDLVALMNSFDILVQKIDGKMDQLVATTIKMQELGADDPAVAELGARAEDMKNILAYVNEKLRSQV